MHAALPVNNQDDLACLGVHVGNYFVNQRSHNALLETHIGGGAVPDGFQIFREVSEFIDRGQRFSSTCALLFCDALF